MHRDIRDVRAGLFFFSSRRRHTRCSRDWSSDVCSSDLIAAAEKAPLRDETTDRDPTYEALRAELAKSQTDLASLEARATATASLVRSYREIGRASCRERV